MADENLAADEIFEDEIFERGAERRESWTRGLRGFPLRAWGRQRLWRGRDAARAHSSSDVGLTFRTCREEA
jgi:hypothetical protein